MKLHMTGKVILVSQYVFSAGAFDPRILLKIDFAEREKPFIDGTQVFDNQNISMCIGKRDVELLIQSGQFAH